MKKTDVINFIKLEKANASKSIYEEYKVKKEVAEKNLFKRTGLDELIEEIQPLMNRVYKIYSKFKEQEEIKQISYCTDALENQLKYFSTKENAKEHIIYQYAVYKSPEIFKLEDKEDKISIKTMHEYESLILNIKRVCKNGKEAEAYVRNLGFDIDQYNIKNECTALMKPIDISLLRLNK